MKKQLLRSEVDQRYTWDTSVLFTHTDEWENEFKKLEKQVESFAQYHGKLGESAATLYQFIVENETFNQRFEKVYLYAHLNGDVDTSNSENQARNARVMQLAAKYSSDTAFVNPEIISLGKEKINQFIKENENLVLYKKWFADILRFADHTLTEKEEKILAAATPVLTNSRNVFSMLNNADMQFDSFTTEDGQTYDVTHSSYGRLVQDRNREIRQKAFESLFAGYEKYKNSFAATLSGETKNHNLNASLRNYKSAREAAVFTNDVPESVQENLLKTVNENLHLLHKYVELRKNLMKLDELYPYDLYPAMVGSVDLYFSIEEAWELVQEALKPLGEEYLSRMRKAYEQRWIDWVDNKGKRSGAYSSGVFGTYPYILMSWQGTLSNVYTLIHELGHSMHSYLTWENQAYPYANYCIFLAEIASTTNENLLTHYLLQKYDSLDMKIHILNHYLDGVKGTVFRQTQFADFEHTIHQADQNGVALTADYLSSTYAEINQKYYGPALTSCQGIEVEWARIPHFYYNYYVYQYATGFSAATAFTEAILSEGEDAVKRYLGFLSSGSSLSPIDTLKKAGVDMTTPQPIQTTLNKFASYMDEFAKLLNV